MTPGGGPSHGPHASGGPLGILAGGGTLPIEIAAHAREVSGREVHVVALQGEADPAVAAYSHTWVNWGQIGGMVGALRRHGCKELVLAGTVRRPNLRTLRPDLGLLLALPKLLRTLEGGDDSVLRRVVGFFEAKGFTVLGLADVAPHLLAPAGALGDLTPTAIHEAAIRRGLAVLQTLGPFDVGQAVVATADTVLAIEGAGGTDAMLDSLGAQNRSAAGASVLVKWPKPAQELRLDLPAIGPKTIERALAAGLGGIAVQAGAAVLLERAALRQAADAARLFVLGLDPSAAPLSVVLEQTEKDLRVEMRSRRVPGLDERRDVTLGRNLLGALAPHGVGGSAIVSRQYVLAVQAQEDVLDLLARAAHLRQWGGRRRRAGTLVVRESDPAPDWLLDTAERDRFLAAINNARLLGLVIMTPGLTKETLAPLVERFDAAKQFLVTFEPAP